MITPPNDTHTATSLTTKMINIFVCPTDVFDEVLGARRRASTWLLPTLAAALTSLLLLLITINPQQVESADGNRTEPAGVSATGSISKSQSWLPFSALLVCGSTIAGTLWSAAVLWVIGRFFLKRAISFSKTLEVVGLAGMVLALGSLITALLILAAGNPNSRPALSLFTPNLDPTNSLRAVLEVFSVFSVWSCVVLGIGLSRLARVSLKEACFWVFSYWFLLRITLILLG